MAKRTAVPEQTFSRAFGIGRSPTDDWFDPALHVDTALFVDPFLMFDETAAPWNTVEDRIVAFFNEVLALVATAQGRRQSAAWLKASQMVSFPEPFEFCLGFSKSTIFGSGAGTGLGAAVLSAAQRAIDAGIVNLRDFDDLMLFGDGFGADRISDMVCNIVKDVFIGYTQGIAASHGLPVARMKVVHTGYDFARQRWRSDQVALPDNPCWQGNTPVLLTPKRFLDELPRMDDGAFWDWAYSNFNQELRSDLGYTVTQQLDKQAILDRARHRATLRLKYSRRYVRQMRAKPPAAYNFSSDPKFVERRHLGEHIGGSFPSQGVQSAGDVPRFVEALLGHFKDMIENKGIWKNMWVKDRFRDEAAAQGLFHLSAQWACNQQNVDISPETDAGVGPVDFKFSRGAADRALVELKLAKSSSYWQNLQNQTPAYMKAADIDAGYFVVLQSQNEHVTAAFETKTTQLATKVAADSGIAYSVVFIDVRKKPSASKLRSP